MTIRDCPTCGSRVGGTATRGPLTVKELPAEVYWHGRRVPMTPLDARILYFLALRGFVSLGGLQMLLRDDCSAQSALKVHVTKIRRALNEAGAAHNVTIRNRRAEGYELEVRV